MQEIINSWLNSSKDYFTGRVIARKIPHIQPNVLELLQGPPSPLSCRVLEQTLQGALLALNVSQQLENDDAPIRVRNVTLKPIEPPAEQVTEEPINPLVYQAAKQQADMKYKEVMNIRAELFAASRTVIGEDVNRPDKVQQRTRLAIDVVKGFIEVSELYDKVDYIKTTGRIPNSDTTDDDDVILIPDIMVKQTLDNLRKNLNKMKKREQTPERIVLQQKHESNLLKLEERWRLLKLV
jgi:hypothetical protein